MAELLKRRVIHLDEQIEKKVGSIDKIVERYGWGRFRALESNALKEACSNHNIIIDCGGGIVLSEENIKLMKKTGKVFFFKCSY